MTVAGLGGEPDYEQRFTAAATDLDRVLKSSGGEAHVYTLTGADSTRQHIEDTLGVIAREAKGTDDLVVILIGHGSFDGIEYKFNLPGPDVSARRARRLVRSHPGKTAADREYDERERGFDRGFRPPRASGDRGHEDWHREERHRVCTLLGRSAARPHVGRKQE